LLTIYRGHWLVQFPHAGGGSAMILPLSRPESYASDFPYKGPRQSGLGMAAMSADGKTLLTAFGRRARFWDIERGRPLSQEIRSPSRLAGACFDQGSSLALLSYATLGRIYDLSRPDGSIQTYAWNKAPLAAVLVQGRAMVTGDADGTLHFWDIKSPKALAVLPRVAPELLSLGFEASGRSLLCLTRRGLLRLGMDGKPQATPLALDTNFQDFRIGPNGDAYLAYDGRELRAYDIRSGRPIADSVLLDEKPSCLALSYDNTVVAAGFKDGSIRLIELQSGLAIGEGLAAPEQPDSLEFSRDGRTVLASCRSGNHRLWILPWLRRKPPTAQRLHQRTLASTHTQLLATGEFQRLTYPQWRRAWDHVQHEAAP
jgi:WD40 repeat protein